MKKLLPSFAVAALCCLAFLTTPATAQVPQLVNYQGRVAVGTVNFNGSGAFKFALVNAAGTTTFWSNDDTSVAGSQPTAAVSLTVTKGLYSVLLGDTSVANMTAIPASVWSNADVRLRVWFNDGTNGSQLVSPDQRLAPNGYLPDGSVASTALASGAVTSAKLAFGAVGSTQLGAGLTLGGTTMGTFSGNGAFLTSVNASNLATGTVADARLSANVALRAGGNTFTGDQIISTGFVGINTVAAPVCPLQVEGIQRVSNGGIPTFSVGTYTGFHMEFDNNEIQSGSAAPASSHPASLFLNFSGGSVEIATNHAAASSVIIGTSPLLTTINLNGTVSPFSMAAALGDKITLYPSGANSYGFGIQGGLLQIHGDAVGSDIAFGYGRSAAFTERMRIKGSGAVGIGTSTPATPLHVIADLHGIRQTSTNGLVSVETYVNASAGWLGTFTNHPLNFFTNNSGAQMTLTTAGSLCIGTTTPTHAKLDVNGVSGSVALGQRGYLDSGGTGVNTNPDTSTSNSIWASDLVLAPTFLAFSDERIKHIEGRSDGARDLKTLLGIEVTDYTFKDKIEKGNVHQKKVIAQQVEKVYPQAVSQHTDVVPDIYEKAAVKDGWVQLATDLKVGDRVRLIGTKEEGIHEVLEVTKDGFRTDFRPVGDQVFVYGREVQDFRAVDYEAIAMLNVSATQELARKLERKDAEIGRLAAENTAMKKQLAERDALDAERDARLARLEQMLPAAPAAQKASLQTASSQTK